MVVDMVVEFDKDNKLMGLELAEEEVVDVVVRYKE